MNPNLQEALHCCDEYLAKRYDMRTALKGLLQEAGFDERKDGVCLELDMSPYIDGNDIEKPRVFLRTYAHTPTVSIQIEQEHATPEEIRRLVPYVKSFPEPWKRASPSLRQPGTSPCLMSKTAKLHRLCCLLTASLSGGCPST